MSVIVKCEIHSGVIMLRNKQHSLAMFSLSLGKEKDIKNLLPSLI